MLDQEIKIPIDPERFVQVFSEKFQNWGNTITDELKETWKQNCLAMNNAIAFKDDGLKFVVSAPTGSAKTENTITYCAMLPSEVKVLIVSNLSAEGIRLADDINREAIELGKLNPETNILKAVAYNSKSIKDYIERIAYLVTDTLDKYQIVIITHNQYKKHFLGSDAWDKLSKDRDLIVIDEAIDTMEELSVTEHDISIAKNFFGALMDTRVFNYKNSERYKKEYDKLSKDLYSLQHINEVDGDSEKIGTRLIYSKEQSKDILIHLGILKYWSLELILEDHQYECSYILTGIKNEKYDKKIQRQIEKTLKSLARMDRQQSYITYNGKYYSYNRVIDHIPNHSVVCFDATSDINQIYSLREKYHDDVVRIPRIPNVRDYSNVNLYPIRYKVGKEAIGNQFVDDILRHLPLGEKTLIITQIANEKIIEDYIKEKHPNSIVDVTHWGAITGLNTWQDFDTCIIAGLNNKPTSFVYNRALAASNEDETFGDNQNDTAEQVRVSDLVAEIIQAFNRIRIRKVTQEGGKCDPANIYITLPIYNHQLYLSMIKAHMTNINIIEDQFNVESLVRFTHFDNIIRYLRESLEVGEQIKITKPRDELGIDMESYRSVFGKDESSRNRFKQKLHLLGFDIIETFERDSKGRERKRPTIYIQRIN